MIEAAAALVATAVERDVCVTVDTVTVEDIWLEKVTAELRRAAEDVKVHPARRALLPESQIPRA